MSEQGQQRFQKWVEASTPFSKVRLGPPIAGGNSNVTRLVETAQGRLVLRHPPADTISDKAAGGIEREFAALTILFGKAPVPEPIAWCDDSSILGQRFSLARFVEGVALTERLPDTYPAGSETIDALGLAMITALGQVHRVDPQPLMDRGIGHPDGFTVRQIDRWTAIREKNPVRPLPLFGELSAWLRANCPVPAAARILHCDFHLDNCLASLDKPVIAAIVDWEMAAVGDPRIDLGLALFFWNRDPQGAFGFPAIQALSNRPGTISRQALAEAWSTISGVEPDQLSYFMAFAGWRLAAIVEGAYALYREGRVDTPYARRLEHDVPALLQQVAAMIEGETLP